MSLLCRSIDRVCLTRVSRLDHKRNLECLAFQYIEELVKPYNPEVAKEIVSAWTEYEEGKTAEAQWVKEMDKLECLIQAFEYEKTEGFDKNVLGEFQSLSSKITSAEGTQWLCILQNERTLHFSKRERCFPVIFMVGKLNDELSSKSDEGLG